MITLRFTNKNLMKVSVLTDDRYTLTDLEMSAITKYAQTTRDFANDVKQYV